MNGTRCAEHPGQMVVLDAMGICGRCGTAIPSCSFKLCPECSNLHKLCEVCGQVA